MEQETSQLENSVSKEAEISGANDKYQLTLDSMLKAGVHFGHKKSRWNPKMKPYIFGSRNGIHIINLEKSKEFFEKTLEFVEEVISKNGIILLVGTKKQAKDIVKSVADRIEMPYVNERWLGGTFTNFPTLNKRVKYLTEMSENLEKGRLTEYTKLEKLKIQKELEKLEVKMGGLKRMKKLPEAIFVLDVVKDRLAVKEAKSAKVAVIGIVDSNSDPSDVDYMIPANDDALSSLKFILGVLLKKVLEKKGQVALNPKEQANK